MEIWYNSHDNKIYYPGVSKWGANWGLYILLKLCVQKRSSYLTCKTVWWNSKQKMSNKLLCEVILTTIMIFVTLFYTAQFGYK